MWIGSELWDQNPDWYQQSLRKETDVLFDARDKESTGNREKNVPHWFRQQILKSWDQRPGSAPEEKKVLERKKTWRVSLIYDLEVDWRIGWYFFLLLLQIFCVRWWGIWVRSMHPGDRIKTDRFGILSPPQSDSVMPSMLCQRLKNRQAEKKVLNFFGSLFEDFFSDIFSAD